MFPDKGQGFPGNHKVLKHGFRDFGNSRAPDIGVTGEHPDGIGLMAYAVTEITVGPVLKTGHLIFSAQVHFTHQTGPVAVVGKVGGPGQMFREYRPVIGVG
jgi:hypothetical protein